MKPLRALVLGDTHTYWERVVPMLENLYKLYNFNTIIQVGDLAYLPKMWSKKMIEVNQLIIDFVDAHDLKFYWIDGNHEDHSILQYIDNFNSSTFNIYGKNFFYMPRGSYLELDRYVLFFIGGAETYDKHNRVFGKDYFLEEIIMRQQEDFVFEQIEKIKQINKPAIIIAHTCPQEAIDDERNLLDLMNNGGTGQNKFLGEVVRRVNPIFYFHGHFHRDRIYHVPALNNFTTFYSIGAWLSKQNDMDDRKYFIVDL